MKFENKERWALDRHICSTKGVFDMCKSRSCLKSPDDEQGDYTVRRQATQPAMKEVLSPSPYLERKSSPFLTRNLPSSFAGTAGCKSSSSSMISRV
jgi:hypothetical protein